MFVHENATYTAQKGGEMRTFSLYQELGSEFLRVEKRKLRSFFGNEGLRRGIAPLPLLPVADTELEVFVEPFGGADC